MKTLGEIRCLIAKNWFLSIVLGSVLISLYISCSDLFYHGHFHFTDTLRVLPIGSSILIFSLVFSLPALLITLIALPAIRNFKLAPILSRYYMGLLIPILLWGSSAIIIPNLFSISLGEDMVFYSLCMFSFSSSYFFMNDENLLNLISTES